jgi:hypothetical protein
LLIEKVNDVLSGGVPNLVEAVDMQSGAAPRSDGDTGLGVEKSGSPQIKVVSSPSEAHSPLEKEISFTATDADTENFIIPKPGSYVPRSSSKNPKRTSSASEREINFCVGGSRLSSAGVPKQGSFVGTSPEWSSSVVQEIEFSPADSDLQSYVVPMPGSFVERDYDPTRPRTSLVKGRNSGILNSTDVLTEGSLIRERNSRLLDGKDLQGSSVGENTMEFSEISLTADGGKAEKPSPAANC